MATKVALIGTGWGVNIQAPIFQQAGLEIAALWARTEEKASAKAAELSIPFGSADFDAVIGQPGVELVSITTPPGAHVGMARTALAAGKHVVCEKPTALNAAEAEQMLAAAQAHSGQLSLIDHELRFLPELQKMRTLIADGDIGDVRSFGGTAWYEWGIDPSWNWWHTTEAGGGVLGAVGSHLIDAATFILDRRAESVSGDLHTFIRERDDAAGDSHPATSDDFFTLRLRFGDIAGLLQSNGISPGLDITHMIAVGSEGTLIFDGSELLRHRQGSPDAETIVPAEALTIPAGLPNNVWVRGSIHLAAALRSVLESGDHSGLSLAATFDNGLHTQRVLDAARASSAAGGWIQID